jgi:hypothetical protein
MKITDMSDSLFNREMQRLLGDVQFWLIRLDQVGHLEFAETPVEEQPFPLAFKLRQVWDYAAGEIQCPEEIDDTIRSLYELLWQPVAGASYDIPPTWWDEPLGFMCRLARARQTLDDGEDLSAEQLAILADVSIRRITQLCASKEISAKKKEQSQGGQPEWSIPAKTAYKWLMERRMRGN